MTSNKNKGTLVFIDGVRQKQDHVDIYKGDKVYLDISPAPNKYFQFTYYVKLKHEIMGVQIERPVEVCGVRLKQPGWIKRLFGIDDETTIEKGVVMIKQRWARMKRNTRKFDAAARKYGATNA